MLPLLKGNLLRKGCWVGDDDDDDDHSIALDDDVHIVAVGNDWKQPAAVLVQVGNSKVYEDHQSHSYWKIKQKKNHSVKSAAHELPVLEITEEQLAADLL